MRGTLTFARTYGLPHLRSTERRPFARGTFCALRSLRMDSAESSSSLTSNDRLKVFRKCIPKWDPQAHKGLSGRIAIVGGCREYTGAPFFSAMASMRAGADLVTVFCDESAATPIKSYSPDLMVSPDMHVLKKDCAALARMHALVIGPGLGRREEAGSVVEACVAYAIANDICVVLDADSLWFLAQSEELRARIRGSDEACFLYATPNVVEMRRLREGMDCETDSAVVEWFEGRLVFLQKGANDLISNGDVESSVEVCGAKKRVGGQGDVLAGIIGLFSFWAKSFCSREGPKNEEEEEEEEVPSVAECKVAAAVAASMVTRRAAEIGFDRKGRSLVTSDILNEIGTACDELEYGSM